MPCWSKLTEYPIREGATVTDDTDEGPEDTTVTGGVVVGTIVEMWDINALQKMYQNEHVDISSADAP